MSIRNCGFNLNNNLSKQTSKEFADLPVFAKRYIAGYSKNPKGNLTTKIKTLVYRCWLSNFTLDRVNIEVMLGKKFNCFEIAKIDLQVKYLIKFNEIGLQNPNYSTKKVKEKANEWFEDRKEKLFPKLDCLNNLKI